MKLSKPLASGATRRAVGSTLGIVLALGVSHGALAAPASSKTLTIALVPGIVNDPFYITMEQGAMAEAKKLGVKLIWEGGNTFSPTTQIPVLQELLAEHPNALLVAPTSQKALVNHGCSTL